MNRQADHCHPAVAVLAWARRVAEVRTRGSEMDSPPRTWTERLRWPRLATSTPEATSEQARVGRVGFVAWVLFVASAYLAVQYLYIRRLPLVMDEFDGAYDVYRLRREIPYLDFFPYKTVLGYYFQLPPLALAPDVWSGLLATKFTLAVANAVSMVAAALLAARRFRPGAVALALPVWAAMSNWLERSSELRVDALTALVGLFGLVALLSGRGVLAGILTALSFLVSQKAVYFLAASLVALAFAWLANPPRGPAFRRLLRFAVGYVALVVPYLAVFSSLASWRRTTSGTFLAHRAIAFSEIYPNIRKFWAQSIDRNPAFYALALLGLCALGVRAFRAWQRRDGSGALDRDIALFAYAWTFAAGMVWHKQPWPYFFVLLAPTAFFLHVVLFESAGRALHAVVSGRWARMGIGGALGLAVLAVAVLAPAQRVRAMLRYDNGYQRHMVEITHALLGPEERYLAGVDLVFDREQAASLVRRMSHSRRVHVKTLPRAAIMSAALELRARPPKLVIRNERYRSFPFPIRRFLETHYADFWGNIRIYAPPFQARSREITLAHPGTYRVVTDDTTHILIHGQWVAAGATVSLPVGRYALRATSTGRLKLTAPEVQSRLDRRYRRIRPLFPAIYSR